MMLAKVLLVFLFVILLTTMMHPLGFILVMRNPCGHVLILFHQINHQNMEYKYKHTYKENTLLVDKNRLLVYKCQFITQSSHYAR